MDEAGRFWEQLVYEWVAIAVGAFALQGVWFGLTAFLVSRQPAWEAALTQTSANLLKIWMLAIVAALGWSVKRARGGDS